MSTPVFLSALGKDPSPCAICKAVARQFETQGGSARCEEPQAECLPKDRAMLKVLFESSRRDT